MTGRLKYLIGPMALFALLMGLASGLARLGWGSAGSALPVGWHGPLMAGAFVGTLIGLERAVGLGRLRFYLGPILSGLSGPLLVGGQVGAARWLMLAASLSLCAAAAEVWGRRPGPAGTAQLAGAGCWASANLLWLAGCPVGDLTFWYAGFLFLTILGERLELAGSRRLGWLCLAVLALLAGLGSWWMLPGLASRLIGLGLAGAGAWLLLHDIARRTAMRPGLPGFVGRVLLGGYLWLLITGVGLLAGPAWQSAGPRYDAVVHGFFLGFVFSMIFAHAPLVLPSVLGVRLAFHAGFYAPPLLLWSSLAVRLAGDLLTDPALRLVGGLGNGLAILLLFPMMLIASRVKSDVESKDRSTSACAGLTRS